MRAIRVTVVSDSHLSERTPEAVTNWRAAVEDLAAAPPDVVVHTGDVAADGPGHAGDLPFARRELDRLAGVPAAAGVRVLPGNHDVGESPGAPPEHRVVAPDLLDVPQVWAPTTWAVLPEPLQPVIGEKACGVVDLSLAADGTVTAGLRRPPGLSQLMLGRDVANPYAPQDGTS